MIICKKHNFLGTLKKLELVVEKKKRNDWLSDLNSQRVHRVIFQVL